MPERADTKGSHWSKPVAPPLHSTSDKQVYALYGLTSEEIQIAEDSIK
jgi:hypothetical protein